MSKTIRELCLENLDTIFVREQVNGKWGSFSLRELSEDLREKHIQRFEDERRNPVRVMESF